MKCALGLSGSVHIQREIITGKVGNVFFFGNGSFIIQIIAQIIIISENFPNKGSRLKNCILLSERYYHHSGVGWLRFFVLLFSIKQRNVHIMLTVAAVWIRLLISNAHNISLEKGSWDTWANGSTALSVIRDAIQISSVMSTVSEWSHSKTPVWKFSGFLLFS